MTNEIPAPGDKPTPKLKSVTYKGKPLCRIKFSDNQFVAITSAIGGRMQCSYEENDPKLELLVRALKDCVKQPDEVKIVDGPCHGGLKGLPPELAAAAQAGLLPPPGKMVMLSGKDAKKLLSQLLKMGKGGTAPMPPGLDEDASAPILTSPSRISQKMLSNVLPDNKTETPIVTDEVKDTPPVPTPPVLPAAAAAEPNPTPPADKSKVKIFEKIDLTKIDLSKIDGVGGCSKLAAN